MRYVCYQSLKQVRRGIQNHVTVLACAGTLLLTASSCRPEGKATPIIIPPGGKVQFSTSKFVDQADDQYQVFIRTPTASNLELKTVLEVTPAPELLLDKEIIHSNVVPKGISLTGTVILHVKMEYFKTNLYAFVFDENPIYPSIATTLVYNLLAYYPNKHLSEYTREEIELLQTYVDDFIVERKEMFGITDDINLDLIYRFYQNGLSNNPEFLDLAASIGVEFDYDATGEILNPPFPYGSPNNLPVLDELKSTPPGTITGLENTTIEIKAEAKDQDGDLIFYAWRRDGEIVLKNLQAYTWTPDFWSSRPLPYPMQLILSDGGREIEVEWELLIKDLNRKPRIIGFCPPTAVEGQLWTCTLTSVDEDLDPIKWKLGAGGSQAVPQLNGQAAPAELIADQVTIEWTPNNADAKTGSAYFDISIDDGKLGMSFRGIPVTVTDNNQAPYIVGGTIIPTNPLHMSPREWDMCLAADPDGGGPFTFDVIVRDPDNEGGANPPDVLNVGISGSLLSYITNTGKTENPTETIFHYEWRPAHSAKFGDLLIDVSDDHGGFAPTTLIPVTAADRNQLACTGAVKASGIVEDPFPNRSLTVTASDFDNDTPVIRMDDFPWEVVPFLKSCTAGFPTENVPIVQTFDDPAPGYTQATGLACVSGSVASSYAGVVIFERNVPYASDINLGTGFKVTTDYASTGLRIDYSMAEARTLKANYRLMAAPLRRSSNSAPANTIKIIEPPLSDPTVVVNNSGAISSTGNVVFSRPAPGAAVIIPAGTIVRTDETIGPTVQTFHFEVPDTVIMDASATNKTVSVTRKTIVVPADAITVFKSMNPDPNLTVRNPAEARDNQNYTIYEYRSLGTTEGVDQFCWNSTVYEGAWAEASEITELSAPLSDPTVQVINNDTFYDKGEVEFYRATGGAAVNIPAGFQILTPNRKKYTVSQAVTLPLGATSVTATVARVPDPSPQGTTEQCLGFRDTNYRASFISNSTATVLEGNVMLGHPIVVSDNAGNPNAPRDPDDRYSITHSFPSAAPTGALLLCREPATDAANFANNCTPCSDTTGLTHHESRRCYLRFNPDQDDVARTFTIQIRSDDNGAPNPPGQNLAFQSLRLVVQEINDPPVFTDDTWAPYVAPLSQAETDPVDMGTFVEQSESQYKFYVYDPDKGTNFKQVSLTLEPQVYDVATSTWMARPAGMTVGIDSYVPVPGGIGGKTTGRITWKPTDEEAKQFSSAEGFVIKVKAMDAPASTTGRNTVYGHFLVRVQNRNNTPEILPIGVGNKFTILADSYFSTTFDLQDPDAFTPYAGTFQTDLNLCVDSNGTYLGHTTLDPAGPLPDCHATAARWPTEVTTFDPAYLGNEMVPECRNGDGTLNEDLAVPKLTRIAGPTVTGEKIQYRYRLEWCPQREHLGEQVGTLVVLDNGDEARDGTLSPKLSGSAPLTLRVLAPVFFVSPSLDEFGQPEHHMHQTAAGLTAAPFRYETIVNNSKGNPLNYELLVAPRACDDPLGNGMCIDEEGVITWVPRYPDDITDSGDPLTWHEVKIQVTDTVTAETDTVHFFMQVQDPVPERPPIIDDFSVDGSAGLTSTNIDELQTKTFAVTASDPNLDDILHFRWYVDGVLKYDGGSSFAYRPSATDGGTDPDGNGPLGMGQHEITVEVDDGNVSVSQAWIASVRNIYLVPSQTFDLVQARAQRGGANVTNVNWLAETSLHTSITGTNVDYLLFTGNYKRGTTIKHFVWSLQMINGEISNQMGSLKNGPWNFYEDLPWGAKKSERVAYKLASGGIFDILITPQYSRTGPFSSTATSVKLRGDLTNTASSSAPIPLGSAQACTGSCSKNHYLGEGGYGSRPAAKYAGVGQHLFWANDAGDNVVWDRNALYATDIFATPQDQVFGLAVNPVSKRLYVTTQNPVARRYQVHVFDITPVDATNPPVLVTTLDLTDGNPEHIDMMPTDVVADAASGKAFIFLSGTGGIAVLDDSSLNPDQSDLTYIGVGQISASSTDLPSSGAKIVYDWVNELAVGVSRLGRQVYTFDPATGTTYVQPTNNGFDAVIVIPESNLTLLIDRSNSKIFRVR